MKRNVTLEEISDGKLYEINDMVKADCADCKGCHKCCTGMGSSIVLDPYDMYVFKNGLDYSFEYLIQNYIELNVVDGLILPNIKMDERKNQCSFLNDEGRCSIHKNRPGMCRLFPLGRIYEDGSFKYFLQIHECANNNRLKIKVKKWLDMENVMEHEKYINIWHNFTLRIQEIMEEISDEEIKKLNMRILNIFYVKEYNEGFYEDFYERVRCF